MLRNRLALGLSLALLVAGPAAGQEDVERFSIRISLSGDDPAVHAGTHEGTDLLDLWVWGDGDRSRGGEFGLLLSGATCVGFTPDADLPWVSLPMVRPYPGTIAQVTAGTDCYDSPLRYGKLTLKPSVPGGRILVDVIPSERAQDITIVDCDYLSANVLMAYPAVVNGGDAGAAPHLVSRPDAPLQLVPDDHGHDDHGHDDGDASAD